ncbi:hypothetical protein MMC13_001230 [Lambiella insularis]|nr:hypothetical protein [Lambiella insularis]
MEIFLLFREVGFDKLYTKIEERDEFVKGDKLLLYLSEGVYDEDDILIPFPEDLVFDKEDRQAVLTYAACGDAPSFLHDFVAIMLESFHARIEEVEFHARNHRRSAVRIIPNGIDRRDSRNGPHMVFKVSLPNGEVFALDIASGQHGFYDAIVPWHAISSHRILRIQSKQPFGTEKAEIEQDVKNNTRLILCMGEFAASRQVILYRHYLEQAAVLCQTMKATLHSEKWENFGPMFKLPHDGFQQKRNSLLRLVREALQDSRNRLANDGSLGQKVRTHNSSSIQPTEPVDPKAEPKVVTVKDEIVSEPELGALEEAVAPVSKKKAKKNKKKKKNKKVTQEALPEDHTPKVPSPSSSIAAKMEQLGVEALEEEIAVVPKNKRKRNKKNKNKKGKEEPRQEDSAPKIPGSPSPIAAKLEQ